MSGMIKALQLTAVMLVAAVLWLPAAYADDRQGTAEEAQMMVGEAIAYFDEVGSEEALRKFTYDPAPMFRQDDLYVFVWGGGEIVAHAVDDTLLGQAAATLKDVDGKMLGQEMLDAASVDGAWVDYKWLNPVTGEVEPKSSWIVLHDGYIFGVGIYKP